MNDLNKYINTILVDTVRAVGKKAMNHLKDNIQKYIYDYGDGKRTTYDPTNQFLNTPTHVVSTNGNTAQVEIYSDTNRMGFDADRYIHGSNNWIVNDIRQWLPEILNENRSGNLFGSNTWFQNREPYFDITVKELIDDGLALKWLKEELKARGLDIV